MGRDSIVLTDVENGSLVKEVKTNEDFDLELYTTISARKIGISSGLFYVPDVINYDRNGRQIIFEYIPSLIPLRCFVENADRHQEAFMLIQRAGKILGTIHSNLVVENIKVPIPFYSSSSSSEECFLHGDYNLENILYDGNSKNVVIIDWAFTPIIPPPGNWGSNFWDIACMLNSIFGCKPYFKRNYSFRRELAEAFFACYEGIFPVQINYLALSRYCESIFWYFAKASLKRNGVLRFLREFPHRYCLKIFADQLKTMKQQ